MKTGIHAIIQKIQADAQEHSDERFAQIKNEIDGEISGEVARHREDFTKRREVLRKHNEHEYVRLSERLSSRLNRELLKFQHGLIDEIFELAAEKLRNVSAEEFTCMFKSAVNGFTGAFTLYLGEYSSGKLERRVIAEAEKAIPGLSLTLSGELIPRKSGFVLADERVEYNWLFEDLVVNRKSEKAAVMFKEVFGG